MSRVINGDIHVSPRTRTRVLKAIEELKFRPNRAAQSLVTRRSHVLEVITFGTTYYGPSQMMAQVEVEAKMLGYNLTLSSVSTVSFEEICEALANVRGRLVDGIIMITPIYGIRHQDLFEICGGVPCVWIDIEQDAEVPSVIIDQHWGGRLVAQHLLDMGHTQICEISGPLNWYGAVSRSQGCRSTLEAAGIEPGLSIEGDWTAAGGYAAVNRLLATGAPFTALAVGNDQMALGAIHALNEHDLRVPEDVSVVGFDDIPEAAHFRPPLTTIRQDFAALGKQSVEYLVSLISQPDTPPYQRVLRPRIVVRRSARSVR